MVIIVVIIMVIIRHGRSLYRRRRRHRHSCRRSRRSRPLRRRRCPRGPFPPGSGPVAWNGQVIPLSDHHDAEGQYVASTKNFVLGVFIVVVVDFIKDRI